MQTLKPITTHTYVNCLIWSTLLYVVVLRLLKISAQGEGTDFSLSPDKLTNNSPTNNPQKRELVNIMEKRKTA